MFRYHLGSVAFGSFILAVVQFIKWWLYWLEKQAEASKNGIMKRIAQTLRCCVTCFEKFIKFLNKNAYIQIALLGKKFCYAAKDAFWLIFRNALRIATAALVSPYPTEMNILSLFLHRVF